MSKPPKIGHQAPSFNLPSTGDKKRSLKDFSNRFLVIYFYPKDSTPGCTTEGQDFRDHYQQFQQLECDILGVSRDSISSHERFKEKQGFPFDLLSDDQEKMCKAFDVIKLKKLYGREYLGIERSTFLIDKRGKLIAEWRKVKVKGHVEDVLKTLKQYL